MGMGFVAMPTSDETTSVQVVRKGHPKKSTLKQYLQNYSQSIPRHNMKTCFNKIFTKLRTFRITFNPSWPFRT